MAGQGRDRTRLSPWARAARLGAVACVAAAIAAGPWPGHGAGAATSPIKHVVVIMMENRTFDNVLGALCVERVQSSDPAPCEGTKQGVLPDGSTIALSVAPDVQPSLNHSVNSHVKSLNYKKGVAQMNGFPTIPGCQKTPEPGHVPYACYDQFDPQGTDKTSITNQTTLANTYTISDMTFESHTSASFISHLELVAGTHSYFHGDNPHYNRAMHPPPKGPGWGCESNEDTAWDDPVLGAITVPSCVPDKNGNGPYRTSPVPYLPTIFDRLDAAGDSWKVYVNSLTSARSPCSYFWECLNSTQKNNVVKSNAFATDASKGNLPVVSFIMPQAQVSGHPTYSMQMGDNWLGTQVHAVENGPEWDSTAIFITYDDCGCFYDHVPPPVDGEGLRVPMFIVSPYAKPHFVDHTDATIASTLAYIESNFGIPPLGDEDSGDYDFSNAFDYSQTPLKPAKMVDNPLPAKERAWLLSHPGEQFQS